jgi:hypothetical protein
MMGCKGEPKSSIFVWQDTQICDTNLLTIDGRAVDGACGCSIRVTPVAHVRQATSAAGALRQRKDRVVHARFAASEWSAAERAARQAGMTLSAFIRSLALDGADVLPLLTEEDREVFELLHRDLSTIGVNLNDVVRLSTGHNLSTNSLAVLRELQPLIAGLMLELRRLAARPGRKIRGRG